MTTFKRLIGISALCLGTTVGMAMAETKLTVSTWLPPTHPINVDMLEGLIETAIAAGDDPPPTMEVTQVADAVWTMATLPPEANVQFMTLMATKMPYIGRG